ncbi:MAG: acyl-CoA thioesterase, partial [Maribacter sp.]|nr:acyl-CoA thioesterase [Maribacter sp.]
MEIFEKTLVVTNDDLDDLEHVNNVRYVQWIQDISKEHWQAFAPKEMQAEVVWVVLTHHISYKGAAKLDEVIRIRTHIAGSKGATTVRVVEMINYKTNHLLLRSK